MFTRLTNLWGGKAKPGVAPKSGFNEEVIAILNEITATHFPDHGWAAFGRVEDPRETNFRMVSKDEARAMRLWP